MGRPTDNPKDISMKMRLDEESAAMLEECARTLAVSKAEVLRRGIHKVYGDLPKK